MTVDKTHLCMALLGGFLLAASAGQHLAPRSAWASEGAASEGKGKGEEAKGEKKEGEGDITGGRFEGDPIYVHVSPLILPIISDDGIEQLVSIAFAVHVKDLDTANFLHRNMPRVVDSLLRHLYGGLDEGTLRNGKLVSVGKVKRKAVAAVAEIIGVENVQDVLVEAVSQRML